MSNLSAFPYIVEGSEATPGLWNAVYSALSSNIASVATTLDLGAFQQLSIGSTPPSYKTTAAVTIEVNSAYSDYLYFVDSSAQKSSYIIGSRAGGTADGLNIWDVSGATMLVSFSKQSVRFFQKIVGPVFDTGGGFYNAASFIGSGSSLSGIQAAINQASIDNKIGVFVPASMQPFDGSKISYIWPRQMVREGASFDVYDAIAYGAAGSNTGNDAVGINAAITAASVAGGATASIPIGQFRLTSPIICLNNVRLTGASSIGFATQLVPVQTNCLEIRGADQVGGLVFRVQVEHLAILASSATTYTPIELTAGYNNKVSDVFVLNGGSGGGMVISNQRASQLNNVVLYGSSTGDGAGLDIDTSDIACIGIDVENWLNCIRVGANTQSDNGVSFYHPYCERFGQYGIRFINTKNNNVYGGYIVAPSGGAFPVGFVGSSLNSCQNNKVFGASLVGHPAGNAYIQNANSNGNMIFGGNVQGGSADGGSRFLEWASGVMSGADLREQSPAALASGNNNDYDLYNAVSDGNAMWVRFSANASGTTLTGLKYGHSGHPMWITNVSANTLTLSHQDANSAAANRFTSPTGGNVQLLQNDCALLMYDGATASWRIASGDIPHTTRTMNVGTLVASSYVSSNVTVMGGDLWGSSLSINVGVNLKAGANKSCGTAVLGSNGSVNVANTYVKTGDLIFLTDASPGGTLGDLEVGGIRNNSGFTIQSTSVTDTSTVNWLIVRPT